MSNNRTEMAFGYYPGALSISAGDIEIQTLPDLEKRTAAVAALGQIERDWFYAPCYESKPSGTRIFGLPKTHIIRHTRAESGNHVEFLIWSLSFFLGIRLTITDMGYLDATPIKPGSLVDFWVHPRILPKLLILADGFWVANREDPMRAKRFSAAIHALFLGQYREGLQFERFIYLYAALDACFALAASLHAAAPKPRIHAERIRWMCSLFGMPTPAWARLTGNGSSELAMIRNFTLHEALYVGEPLGFGLYGIGTNQNLTLQMEALVCRLLVALIGAPAAGYVTTPIDTQQRQALEL